MEIYSILGSVTTVVTFVVFMGIVFWAYGSARREAFAMAAQAPFALPDEDGATPRPSTGAEETRR